MVGQASTRAYGYFYVLALRARSTPTRTRLRMPEGRSRGARGLIGRAGDELRPSRTQRFASAAPTSLRTAAQLERLADRSRASSAKLARIWRGSRLAPVRGRVSAGLVNAVSRSSGRLSEFSERRFDAPERGGQRGSGVPRARRGPKPLRRLEQRTGLVVELIRRITLGGAQRRSSARRAQLDMSSLCHATEPRKAGYGRQWGLSCSRHVSAVARLGRMCGSTHRQGQPLQRSLADAVPQTTPGAHAFATALPATRRRRVRLEHRG